MENIKNCTVTLATTALVLLVFSSLSVVAAENKDMKGWGINDTYNKHYNPKELDSLKGNVKKFKKVSPLPGMSPGTAFILDEGEGDTTLVHLCPQWFAKKRDTGIRKGDRVKVKGAWAEIKGKDVFIASKVKKDNGFQFKVRLTKDGTPFWTMSKEELDKEMNGN